MRLLQIARAGREVHSSSFADSDSGICAAAERSFARIRSSIITGVRPSHERPPMSLLSDSAVKVACWACKAFQW